eukprot:1294244-Pleurochrysis_carterae.AAC.1
MCRVVRGEARLSEGAQELWYQQKSEAVDEEVCGGSAYVPPVSRECKHRSKRLYSSLNGVCSSRPRCSTKSSPLCR